MRVAIFGTSGAGKTTLSRAVGARLGVPVVELDALNWRAGWRDRVTHEPEAFLADMAAALAVEAWVTDGNYSLGRRLILDRATDIVWLDYSRWVIMTRVIRRSVLRSLSGQELWPGTGNREDWRRWIEKDHPIRWAWDTYEGRRARYGALFADPALAHLRRHRLDHPRQAGALVAKLEHLARETPS
jgi:adenylate kinase family enzyme